MLVIEGCLGYKNTRKSFQIHVYLEVIYIYLFSRHVYTKHS